MNKMNSIQKIFKYFFWRTKKLLQVIRADTHFYYALIKTGSVSSYNQNMNLFRNPIIIGGCGRSGTTLLLSVLSCHPEIFAIGDETGALCPNTTSSVNAKFLLRKDIIIQHLLQSASSYKYLKWCEKTPRNVLSYERLLNYFGKRIRILNIVRDGRDVVTSMHPSIPENYYVSIDRWISHVEAGIMMENHPQVLTVKYEDLVMKYEETLTNICVFLGMEFNEKFLGYPDTANIQGTAEGDAWAHRRLPINPRSIGRWVKPEHKNRVETLMSNPRALSLLIKYEYITK